jgi:hypothetical protein
VINTATRTSAAHTRTQVRFDAGFGEHDVARAAGGRRRLQATLQGMHLVAILELKMSHPDSALLSWGAVKPSGPADASARPDTPLLRPEDRSREKDDFSGRWWACCAAFLSTLTASGGRDSGAVTGVSSVTAPLPAAYTVGGSVTGLAGSGLVLQSDFGGNLAISASGSFKFHEKVRSGF